ncbi:hypothetical protein WMY93_022888 [Mugilogobius chulae]|uniref:Uncharacterized protein n=1 Tax=Mugilogobius chulae TaxID=88201 RepID=A0AAW0NDT2_9GOBI
MTSGGQRKLRKGAVPVLFHWNNYSLPPRRLSVWERQPPPLPPTTTTFSGSTTDRRREPCCPCRKSEGGCAGIAPDHDYFVTPRTGMRVVELQDQVDKLREENELLRRQMDELTLGESLLFGALCWLR